MALDVVEETGQPAGMEPTWKPPGLVGEAPIGQPGDITLGDLLHFATR